jgi:hypoxia up-regulated 1
MDAEIKAYEDKMKEVTGVAAPIFFRLAEKTARKEAVEDLRERVQKVKDMLKKWERTMPHVTEEEKGEVLDLIEGAETWVSDKLAAQAGTEAHEKPAFESKQVPGQLDRIVRMMDKLRKKEKPKPVKVENATDADNATAADADGEEAEDLDAAAEDGAGAEAEAAAGDDAAPEKDEEGSDEL